MFFRCSQLCSCFQKISTFEPLFVKGLNGQMKKNYTLTGFYFDILKSPFHKNCGFPPVLSSTQPISQKPYFPLQNCFSAAWLTEVIWANTFCNWSIHSPYRRDRKDQLKDRWKRRHQITMWSSLLRAHALLSMCMAGINCPFYDLGTIFTNYYEHYTT